MKVPFIDISRYENGLLESLTAKTAELLRKAQFIGGPEVAALEESLSQYTGSAHAVTCANGTDALQVALRGCGIGAGDKVLLSDFNFWAAFEAVVNVGAKPVTMDVDAASLHVTRAAFVEAVKKFKPKAAVLVHLYGWAAPETDAIRATARDLGILLVEDCAQAFGTRRGAKALIGSAHVATTSFYPAKVLGASGDAGAIFTQDEKLAATFRSLCNHGRSSHYSYGHVGWNSRLGAYEAAFLNAGLPHLEARIESRRRICERYRQELKGLPLRLLAPAADVHENGYCSVALCEPSLRNKLQEKLKEAGVGTGVIYPEPLSVQLGAKAYLAGSLGGATAARLCQSLINLPCFSYMRDDECDYVISSVREAVQWQSRRPAATGET